MAPERASLHEILKSDRKPVDESEKFCYNKYDMLPQKRSLLSLAAEF